jgi:uncharacterized protein YkwD
MLFRLSRYIAAALLAGLAAAPVASAQFGPYTIKVVDGQGRPQVAAVSYHANPADGDPWTDATGVALVNSRWSKTVYVSRDPFGDTDPACHAPEGHGVPVRLSDYPTGSTITVTLPSIPFPAAAPALDAEEERLISLWRAHRRALGLSEVALHPALNAAADAYTAHYAGGNLPGHCAPIGGVPTSYTTRAHAFGFTGPKIWENIVWGLPVADQAFAMWLSDPGHRASLENPRHRWAGIARNGSNWVLMFSDTCVTSCEPVRAGAGRLGPYDPGDDPGHGGSGDDGERSRGGRPPTLRAIKVRRAGPRTYRIRVAAHPAAKGKLALTARRGARHRRCAARARTSRTCTVKLTRGRWKLTASFTGRAGWRAARRVLYLTVR